MTSQPKTVSAMFWSYGIKEGGEKLPTVLADEDGRVMVCKTKEAAIRDAKTILEGKGLGEVSELVVFPIEINVGEIMMSYGAVVVKASDEG